MTKRRRKRKSIIGRLLSLILWAALLILLAILGMYAGNRYGWLNVSLPWQETEPEEEWDRQKEGYYYAFLTEEEKQVYRAIVRSCEQFVFDVKLNRPVSEDSVFHAAAAVAFDDPEYYWVNSTYTYYRNGNDEVNEIEFESDGTEQQKTEQLRRIAEEVKRQLPEEPYEAYRYLFEYVIDATEYDEAAAESGQNLTSVFFDHRSVCAGYSKAFQYLCRQAGLSCVYVTGTAVTKNGSASSHAWNLIEINNQNYWVDVTWGDPMFEGYATDLKNYNYFCVSDATIHAEHQIETAVKSESGKSPLQVSYPECPDDSLDWYRLNGCYFETFDHNAVRQVIQNSLVNGKELIALKFSSYDVMMDAVSDLIYREQFFAIARDAGVMCRTLSYVTYDGIAAVWIIPGYEVENGE